MTPERFVFWILTAAVIGLAVATPVEILKGRIRIYDPADDPGNLIYLFAAVIALGILLYGWLGLGV